MAVTLRTLCMPCDQFFSLQINSRLFFLLKKENENEKLTAVSRFVSFVQILRFGIDCTSSTTYTQVTTVLWRAHQSITSRAFKITVDDDDEAIH